jgi:orotidine-5'-phosphate decarboxylase
VVTPRAAAAAGATYVVLGRAVTAAPEPAGALAAIVAELRA